MKTALITGGTGGIGRALVRAFTEAGYSVAFTYKSNTEAAEELKATLGAYPIRADVRRPDEIMAAVADTVAAFGKIDCLVNNAGASRFGLFTDLSLCEWEETVSVNLTSAFLFSREAVPNMLFRKCGRIINISSMWGLVGASCEVAYSTAKAGLIGFTKSLAKELAPSGITVNAIAPGVIDTPMNAALGEETLAALAEETPVGRLGKPEEVAAAAVFLASDSAAFITGEVLNISGGFVI
ncbi:MAG: 3-oxoacyl-ACP reductase FabG [Clostridia bacterium]|nr:3-oxoacyl-ACP reductase FabG [Clostridia bacterium]MBR3681331.1 3-oxoacyl-ACP reductase FabG [Clostridia bacterium]